MIEAHAPLTRAARESDYPSFARLFVELAVPEPTPNEAWWAARCGEALVLELDGVIIGYLIGNAQGEVSYVNNVVIAPEHRGRRYGEALMLAWAARARSLGFSRWALFVKVGNVPAIRLYERLGMRLAHRTWSLSIDRAAIARLASDDAETTPLASSDEPSVEQALGHWAGRITAARSFPGRTAWVARRGERVVGVMVFDPGFPGSPLTTAVDAAALRSMLEAVLAAHPSVAGAVRVTIEHDAALVATLIDAGAETMLELHRMFGDLPS